MSMDTNATLRALAQWKAEGLVPADVHASAVKQIFEVPTAARHHALGAPGSRPDTSVLPLLCLLF